MKRIGNFIYEHRILNVINRHGPMLLKPATMGVFMLIIWYFLYKHGIYLDKSDLPFTVAVPLIGIVYGIFAGLAINSTWEKYKNISASVVRGDKSKFLELRDEKIPIMLHILLGGMAFFIQILVMLIEYQNFWTGELLVFMSAFLLCLTGLIALELDNPQHGVWFQKTIPTDWADADIKKYFEEEDKFRKN